MPEPNLLDMDCRVCGRRDVEEVLDLGDQPHCNSLLTPDQLDRPEPVYPLRLGFCRTCTTSQIDFTVPKETMFSDYLYVSGTTTALRDHFRHSAGRLVDRLGLQPGDLVVDIGSNDGTWLKAFQDLGLTGLGVEPAANLAEQAERDGVRTLNAFFDADVAQRILSGGRPPKLVTAAGVFFHLEELHSATEGVAALCGAGATFCVQAIYLGGMIENNAFDQIYHEHLTYWNLTSFERLLDRHGLEVLSVEVVPIHGGSLELLVGAKGAARPDSTVAPFREHERERGLTEIGTYRAFADRVWAIRDRLIEQLEEHRAADRSVHAFGAPAKGATLLNSFRITPELVQVAVERNPLKVGRTIPGCRIPIVEEGSIDEPDAYLMLPWNFLDEFVARRSDYLEGGGEFIVPIPEPHVVRASAAHQRARP
ncbi:MAG: class I SAM-dependent methyltransferase [Actinomycetota bacterium]|nr:class I SAM-dependent methyltransferase [Actinomycetota bacterium]